MTRTAIVRQPTIAIAHTGNGTTLPAGTYEVAELDGAAERGQMFLIGPGGLLVQVDPRDPNITIEGALR